MRDIPCFSVIGLAGHSVARVCISACGARDQYLPATGQRSRQRCRHTLGTCYHSHIWLRLRIIIRESGSYCGERTRLQHYPPLALPPLVILRNTVNLQSLAIHLLSDLVRCFYFFYFLFFAKAEMSFDKHHACAEKNLSSKRWPREQCAYLK